MFALTAVTRYTPLMLSCTGVDFEFSIVRTWNTDLWTFWPLPVSVVLEGFWFVGGIIFGLMCCWFLLLVFGAGFSGLRPMQCVWVLVLAVFFLWWMSARAHLLWCTIARLLFFGWLLLLCPSVQSCGALPIPFPRLPVCLAFCFWLFCILLPSGFRSFQFLLVNRL